MPARKKKPSAAGGRTLLAVLFAVYLALLAWTVLFKLEVPFVGTGELRRLKLVPFASGGGVSANTPLELAANVVLFVPCGVYLGLLATRWSWWRVAGVLAAMSLLFEVGQFVLAIGVSDVTDVIVNTAGGLAGLGVLAVARRRLRDRTTAVMGRFCAIATVLALLAAGAFVASPLHYGPQHQAGATRNQPQVADLQACSMRSSQALSWSTAPGRVSTRPADSAARAKLEPQCA